MSKSSRGAQLAKLRDLRKSGKSAFDDFQPDEEELYDEVDADHYKQDLINRIGDDFVVDDNGEGYIDDGRSEASYGSQSCSDDGGAAHKSSKPKTKKDADRRKREKDAVKAGEQTRINSGISRFFQAKASAPRPKPAASADDDAFMAGLLGQVTADVRNELPSRPRPPPGRPAGAKPPPPLPSLSRPAPKRPAMRPTTIPRAAHFPRPDVLPKLEPASDAMDDIDDDLMLPDDGDFDVSFDVKDQPSSPIARAIDRKPAAPAIVKTESFEDQMDDLSDLDISEPVGLAVKPPSGPVTPTIPALTPRREPALPSSSPTRPPAETVDASQWTQVTASLNVQKAPHFDPVPFDKINPRNVLEEDGSMMFYWLDYLEIGGSLCLFGKVKDKSSGRFESAFVKIDNILRKLYFLPRETRRGGSDQDEVTMGDVFEEIDGLMSRLRIPEHKSKVSSRRYAFELADVPREAEYLKLLYPYDRPVLGPSEIGGGDTYSHVFGTHTALFEQFVLWKNVMGPCWLRIGEPDLTSIANASWCKVEAAATKPALISVMGRSEDENAPPLTTMSVSIRTSFNSKDNRQEIVMISARVYENVVISEPTPADRLPSRTISIIRPINGQFPLGFRMEVQKHNGAVHMEQSEALVLGKLMGLIQQVDPDVLVGHRLSEIGISLLLSRMRDRKTPGWSRMGRLRRSEWPRQIGRGSASMFVERTIVSGRLICDLANDMGKSAMPGCQTWTLTEMVELGLGARRTEFDEEAALRSWASKAAGLMNFVRHCETDTFFIAAIAIKIQLLPLTKVLTNLAGNSWARTLTGTRAERNEFILLHEFYRLKYLCPDKRPSVGAAGTAATVGTGQGAPTEADKTDGKKDKYQGGLVFEPEKGLYDEFILVMDFNSLYPSIIQEFNICFTTVDRTRLDPDTVPDVPAVQAAGVLPRLISTLVSRRREVKKLMGSKTATADERMTWDIKQLALKLTANSMYGCLGYVRSRFYARPLAMLITFKGREILRSTKELAEKQDLRVIYGDTDSVMINTHAKSLADAMVVGRAFKKSVNDQYRLLEIDIDNVFRRLLLHAKKKYAAINVPIDSADPNPPGKLEVKGLDMRRREFCALSKETSTKLLDFLLSGADSDEVVTNIHEYLRKLATRMREFQVPDHMYTIHTQLGKDPREYDGSAANAPAVQVALRELSRGKPVKAKDVMSFIMTEPVPEGDDPDGNKTTKSSDGVPYTVGDVVRADSKLRPNIEYYLQKQILPPVERLCGPIEGTTPAQLADCLGLDTRRYQSQSGRSGGPDVDIQPLESQIPDAQRFKDTVPPLFRCRSCTKSARFHGLTDQTTLDNGIVTRDGIRCSNSECGSIIPVHSLSAQLEAQIRLHSARYYSGWLVCDDAACEMRTRQVCVGAGSRCLGSRGLGTGCVGKMQVEYGEKQMYNQLLFFQRLFDVDDLVRRVRDGKVAGLSVEDRDRVVVLASQNRARFDSLCRLVRAYLDKNGRQWVDMRALFAFALA